MYYLACVLKFKVDHIKRKYSDIDECDTPKNNKTRSKWFVDKWNKRDDVNVTAKDKKIFKNRVPQK